MFWEKFSQAILGSLDLALCRVILCIAMLVPMTLMSRLFKKYKVGRWLALVLMFTPSEHDLCVIESL